MLIHRALIALWLMIGLTTIPVAAQENPRDDQEKSIFDFGDEEMDPNTPDPKKPSPRLEPRPSTEAKPPADPRPTSSNPRQMPSPMPGMPIRKEPVPARAEIDAAKKVVVETYPDLNSPTAATRTSAMFQARAQARDMSTPPAQRYALFDVVREVAEKIGNASYISVTITEMERHFEIDGLAMHVESIGRMSPTTDNFSAAYLCIFTAERAAGMKRPVEIRQALEPIEPLLARLPKETAELLRQRKRAVERVAPHLATLQQRPDDPAANFAVGSYYAMTRRSWTAGLPLLAKGTDGPIKALAQRELSAPVENTDAQLEIADGWWQLSQGNALSESERAAVQWHAGRKYLRIKPKLQGIQAVLADKRIKESKVTEPVVIGRPTPSGTKAQPVKTVNLDTYGGRGLLCEVFSDRSLKTKVGERIDLTLDSYFGNGTPGLGAPADNFSVRWTGYLRAPRAGSYVMMLQGDDGFRMWIDDKLLIDSWDKGGAEQAIVELSGRPQKLKVEFWDHQANAWALLQWKPPGSQSEVIVSEQYFFVDEQVAAKASLTRTPPDNGGGLQLTIFRGQNLKDSIGSDFDRQVNSHWRNGAIADRIPENDFSVRWHGFLVVPKAGTYQLRCYVDDGARIYLDRKLVLDRWKGGPSNVNIELTDAPAELAVEYRETKGPARISLHWEQVGGFAEEIIPPSAFYRTRDAAMKAIAAGKTR